MTIFIMIMVSVVDFVTQTTRAKVENNKPPKTFDEIV